MWRRSEWRDTFTTNMVGLLLLQAFARCVILSNPTWHFFATLIGRKATLFSRTGWKYHQVSTGFEFYEKKQSRLASFIKKGLATACREQFEKSGPIRTKSISSGDVRPCVHEPSVSADESPEEVRFFSSLAFSKRT